MKKPMLANKIDDWTKIQFPIYSTPKLDGIRVLMVNGQALSRTFKQIPNHHIRNYLESNALDGLDGELICPGKTFNETQSLVMTENGTPDFQYVAFDYVHDIKEGYLDRIERLKTVSIPNIKCLLPTKINNIEELQQYEQQCITEGYEGVMIRSPNGPYKEGRSTVREGYLLKIKRFEDAEAIILDFDEKMHNDNDADIDNFGNTKRSSHKDNMKPAGTLGSLLVRDIKTGVEFSIGSGFDDNLRQEIWDNRIGYTNKIVSYTFQPSGGKDKPRFPIFKGFRHIDDIT